MGLIAALAPLAGMFGSLIGTFVLFLVHASESGFEVDDISVAIALLVVSWFFTTLSSLLFGTVVIYSIRRKISERPWLWVPIVGTIGIIIGELCFGYTFEAIFEYGNDGPMILALFSASTAVSHAILYKLSVRIAS